MPFSESLKLKIKKKADFRCCLCENMYVEIHHIIPQEESGPDTEDNAAPLCPSCHEIWGDNKSKRKFIREKRDHWYELCEKKFSQYSLIENNFVTKEDLKLFERSLTDKLSQQKIVYPFLERLFKKLFSIDALLKTKILIKSKDYNGALNILTSLTEDELKKSESHYLRGYVYGEMKDVENMIISFNKANEIDNLYNEKIKQSLDYYWAINFNKGIEYFNKAVKSIDNDTAFLFYSSSIDSFERAIKCKPHSPDAYLNIVYIYFNTKRVDKAIPILEKTISVSYSPEIVGMLGQVYNEKGSELMDVYKASNNEDEHLKAMDWYNKSILLLEEARTKFPDDGDILLRLSNAYIGANKLDVAMNAFKAGVEKEPENKYYRYNYGVLLLNSKDYAAAEVQFKKAVEVDPDYTNAVYNLAVTYVRWGAQIREDMESKGEMIETYKDKFSVAIPYLEKYLATSPNEPLIWELLGRVYTNLGLHEKSEEAFKKTVSIKAEN